MTSHKPLYLGACYIRTKVTKSFVRKLRCAFVGEPLNHIHKDTKSARLIAVCKRSVTRYSNQYILINEKYAHSFKWWYGNIQYGYIKAKVSHWYIDFLLKLWIWGFYFKLMLNLSQTLRCKLRRKIAGVGYLARKPCIHAQRGQRCYI